MPVFVKSVIKGINGGCINNICWEVLSRVNDMILKVFAHKFSLDLLLNSL